MKKLLLAMIISGLSGAVNAGVLASQVAEASTSVTFDQPALISNSLSPAGQLIDGTNAVGVSIATGEISADDGHSHQYVVTFPDDIIETSGTAPGVNAVVSGMNNPENKLKVVLVDNAYSVANTIDINGKPYLLLPQTGSTSNYSVISGLTAQTINADNYTIKTQAYVYTD